MPLRDYQCEKCGKMIEKYFHKESEVDLPEKCPYCKKKTTWKRMPPMVAPGKVKGGTPKFYAGK